MKKLKKIMIIFILVLLLICCVAYAKYTFYFEEVIANLNRESELPVCKISYSTEEPTNQNVVVTITSNEEIEQVSGFKLSTDKKVLTKEVSQNERKEITIRDLSRKHYSN